MLTLESNAVLLIIDMQQGMLEGRPSRGNNPDAELNLQRLLAAWRASLRAVVHVRHISRTPGSVFWPGQPGCEFQPALAPLDTEHVCEKNVPDAFAQTGLERWLHQRNVRQLVIAGVLTNNSLEASVRAAGCLGFEVVVVADGSFAYEQRDHCGRLWSAQDVHAFSLSNMALDYATVAQVAQVIDSLARSPACSTLPTA